MYNYFAMRINVQLPKKDSDTIYTGYAEGIFGEQKFHYMLVSGDHKIEDDIEAASLAHVLAILQNVVDTVSKP